MSGRTPVRTAQYTPYVSVQFCPVHQRHAMLGGDAGAPSRPYANPFAASRGGLSGAAQVPELVTFW